MKKLSLLARLATLLCGAAPLFLSSCGGGGADDPVIDEPLPASLVSSVPGDGDTVDPESTTTLTLTFDQAITTVMAQSITLNGDAVATATASGRMLTVPTGRLEGSTAYTLRVGTYALRFEEEGFNKREYTLAFSTSEREQPQIKATLAVPNPSAEAVSLYAYLRGIYGQKTLSGMMADVAWNHTESDRVAQLTGKYPAINGYDYIHLAWSPANWIDYGDITPVSEWWDAGGIVYIGWHWCVPSTQPAEGATVDPATLTYQTGATTFRTANATVEGTWENDWVRADLAKLAGYLKLLRDAGIPVLWRPLHEASGNIYEYTGGTSWFWWGNDGGAAYVKLWRYMFDYFAAEGLNNLVWVWTTQTKDDAFYPGDGYVDIIGRDLYGNTTASCVSQYRLISQTYADKLVALAECGWSDYTNSRVGPISEQWTAGARWMWFMPWYDNDGAANAHATDAWWQDAMNQPYVVTRDQLDITIR
ncbi:MAG: beta-mannosidase [Mediterranea sp.]|jgi:mannan endo-1,4-beta-mannosidase|nr:beta-mannosidase [Mediterranea sp.]